MAIVHQLSMAGIASVSLTGGEPLVREDFWDIVDALLENEIRIDQIYTNGMLVNDTLLDGFDKRGIKPAFSLSFDGIGWHDWLRGWEGAEQIALNAIKLLLARGFTVTVESVFHRDSVGTLVETMHLMAELGVHGWKTNPVSASGQWLDEGRDLDLTAEELYGAYLQLIPRYLSAGSPINIQLGGFFACEKGRQDFYFPVKKPFTNEAERLKEPLCMSARHTMYISADAKLLPCIPLSGLPAQDAFPNLYDITLVEALNNSVYMERISAPVCDLLSRRPECAACEFRLHCNGGCRAAALAENDSTDYFGIDSWTCRFFKGGYEERIKAEAFNATMTK
jgi:radical SAM protein with 4Fe4S-binding SPASM domain